MRSSLHLQQCPACLVRLNWMVCKMGVKWPYSCCFVVCCFQDLFKYHFCVVPIQLLFFFFFLSKPVVGIQVLQPYCSTDMATTWKKSILFYQRSNFHVIDNVSVAVHVFPIRVLISLSVDEIVPPGYGNCSSNFRGWPFNVDIAPSTCTLFYLRSSRSQCFLLLAPGYAAGIWLGQVYLQEAQDHLRLSSPLWNIVDSSSF